MESKLTYKKDEISTNLPKLADKTALAVLMYAQTKAEQMKSQMKIERPWTDRTSMAKTRLDAKVSQPNNHTIRLTLSHGVDYGIYLELAHEKEYAIIAPTIRKESPKVVEGLNGLLKKVRL